MIVLKQASAARLLTMAAILTAAMLAAVLTLGTASPAYASEFVPTGGAGATALAGDSGASGQSSETRNGQIFMFNWDSGDMEIANPNGSGLRNAPSALRQDGSFAWSPDGKQLAFFYGEKGPKDTLLYLAGAGGQHPRRLAACGGCTALSWSPDGSQIAVVRGWYVWVVNAKTGAMRRITHCPIIRAGPVDTGRCVAYDSALEWSPAGGRILFIGPDPAAPDVTVGVSWSLDTISPDGSDPTTLTTGPPSSGFPGETELVGGEPSPQWSPDGSEIAFDLHNGIYIINADGTGLSRLVATGGQPAWSPDGTRLLYETFGAPPASLSRLWSRHIELWMINADGSDNRLLYRYPWPIGENGASWDAHVWSPDGKQIAFSTRSPSGAPSDTEAGAFVMNANGSDLHRIARGGWPVLAWRPVP